VQEQNSIGQKNTNPAGYSAASEVAVVDWPALVDHRTFVRADETLEQVQQRFQQTNLRYMAVVEGDRAIGLCASRQVAMRLGSQYGFALFGREPIRSCLVPEPLIIRIGQPWADVLQRVFSRTREDFSRDVLLVDEAGGFRGLISVQNLVRLQNRLLTDSIARLEQQQAEISRRNRQMTEDLLMAREMQMAMLPRGLPDAPSGIAPGRGAVRVLSHYAPLGLVSGDFFEVLAVSESAVGILIADVMGHGVQAALVTAMMRALIQDHGHLAADPGAFLTVLNNRLTVILEGCQLPTFVSAFALVADVGAGSLAFANAGHPCPVLLRRGAGKIVSLDCEQHSNGGLLGISRDAGYATGRMELAAGDRVLLFTDGLFEIQGGGGEILGLPGLAALASSLMAHPGGVFVEELVRAARDFSPNGRFEDDVCLVGLEVLEIPGPISE
jgi:sigma-B regulation protein RsbU (phosphoserine phosphatase)